MITVDVRGHGVAVVDFDAVSANFSPVGWMTTSRVGHPGGPHAGVRLAVEVQRRLGGLAPRALLGGIFEPDLGETLRVEVAYVQGDQHEVADFPSRLWKRPFTAGLPEEFAHSMVEELLLEEAGLPSGRLRIDYAGHDEVESSAKIFAQGASVLREALLAALDDGDIAAATRQVIGTW